MKWYWWILIIYASVGMGYFTYFEIYRREINAGYRARARNLFEFLLVMYFARPLVFAIFWIAIPGEKGFGIPFIQRKLEAGHVFRELKQLVNRPIFKIDKSVLRHTYMGGAGEISCRNCFYTENIVSFLHGFGHDPWTKTGYQCQSCGKFHAIENDHKLDTLPSCECGGELSREEPLFCPKCRSTNLEYNMHYIT